MRDDVPFLRARIRYQGVHHIPEYLNLTVDDTRFRIPIEIESWEEANSILIGKDLDRHLGLDTAADQETFLRRTGFTLVPAMANQGGTHLPSRECGGERRRPTVLSVCGSRSPGSFQVQIRQYANHCDRTLSLLNFCLTRIEG